MVERAIRQISPHIDRHVVSIFNYYLFLIVLSLLFEGGKNSSYTEEEQVNVVGFIVIILYRGSPCAVVCRNTAWIRLGFQCL